MNRMRINQPSSQQPCHQWHGTCVLGVDHGNGDVTIYWLRGPVTSSLVPRLSVSPGWPEHLAPK